MKNDFPPLVVLLSATMIAIGLSSCNTVHKNTIRTDQDYVVFAWNDLGMHCLNPSYDKAVILPPYNTIWAEVIKRGDPPVLVTQNVNIFYEIKGNTTSYNKGNFGAFWDNAEVLFGVSLARDTGLNLKIPDDHNALKGKMVVFGNHFEAVGIPVVPVDDTNNWNPFQIAIITAKDLSGQILAQTEATVPTSDEINCAKCHGPLPFQNIAVIHDRDNKTNLESSPPFLCAKCHGTPALGQTGKGESGHYLSQAIHGFHANKEAECYDCHPGNKTRCSRSLAHTTQDGNCITCHGEMTTVANSIAASGRIPWLNEPRCVTCHKDVPQVDTGATLYRDARGHGDLACPTCHGSPHAMVPSRETSDNYQAIQYQSVALPLGSCRVCHHSSRGGGSNFSEKHTGMKPNENTACNVCHTAVHDRKSEWPHQFQL